MLNYTTYLHSDQAPWVTFVHGAGGSSSIWYKQIRSFKENHNVLVLDLRGHGNSKLWVKGAFNPEYTFDMITADITEVLNYLTIEKSHFVGISLGTILIRDFAEKYPERVTSMILAGAIMKLNFKSQLMMKFGAMFKSVIPYMLLYKTFAFVIMPRKNHRSSRLLFIGEAKKMCQKEFNRWFKLTSEINPLLKYFRLKDIKIKTLYIMGEQDHLFLPTVQNIVASHTLTQLCVIKNCGHVVNVDQPLIFNKKSIDFLTH